MVSVVAVASVTPTQQVQPYNNATPTTYQISHYDMMFREVGGAYGIDWRLLSAIARVESQFRFDAVSKSSRTSGESLETDIFAGILRSSRCGYENVNLCLRSSKSS